MIDSSNPTQKVAEKDIRCYKTLKCTRKNMFSSLYLGATYDFNKSKIFKAKRKKKLLTRLKVTREPRDIDSHGRIHSGIHTFSSLVNARDRRDYGEALIRFIIPKGTRYYENSSDLEYVSLAIKFDKIITHGNK